MPQNKKEKKPEIDWDKKKIFLFAVGLVVLLIVLVNAKSMILGETYKPAPKTKVDLPQVKGISTQDISNNVRKTIEDLQTQANNLDVVEVASSSPQVQKILNDLKSLQNLPKNEIKNVCDNICNKL